MEFLHLLLCRRRRLSGSDRLIRLRGIDRLLLWGLQSMESFPEKNLEIKLFFQILACRVKWFIERICRKNLILAEISKLELNWTAQSFVPSFWTFYKTSNTHNERRADRGRLGHVVWLGDDRRHIPERRLATGRRRSLEFIHFFIKQDLKINTLLAKNAHNKMWQFSDKAYIIRKKTHVFRRPMLRSGIVPLFLMFEKNLPVVGLKRFRIAE